MWEEWVSERKKQMRLSSSCRWNMDMWLGTATSLWAIAASTLLFPLPLFPINP